MTVYKNITMCSSQSTFFLTDFRYLSNTFFAYLEEPGDVPAFVTVITSGLNFDSVIAISIATGATAGTYTIPIGVQDIHNGTVIEHALIVIEITEDCIQEQELCCTDGVGIRWLSKAGGIKEWVFPGVREFEVRVGDAITFKNTSLQKRYSERKDIYTGKTVNTKRITQAQYDFLTELKYAIQAWEIVRGELANGDETVDYIPILIDNDSFSTYTSRTKIFEFGLTYILAEETQMQVA